MWIVLKTFSLPIPTNHLFNPSVRAFGTASGPRGPTHSQVSILKHMTCLSPNHPIPCRHQWFMNAQCDIEVQKSHFSAPFGRSLLLEMYCMPVHAIPKPNSSDLWLITDHLVGPFSLNSMIPRNTYAMYPLDNLHLLGKVLLSPYTQDLDNPILYKSDVAEAYCLMPMHPVWQVKQAICTDGKLHIDRCGVFGGWKSGNYSVTFHSLVCWIAHKIKGILLLQVYSDNFYGLNKADDFTFYPPYKKHLLTNQYHLLCLWDKLGIPHKEKKQVSGAHLVIIGIEVDSNHLTFTLPAASRNLLLSEIVKFCQQYAKKVGVKATGSSSFPLKKWQHLAGWLNWSFNVYAYLRPCLNNIYHKIGGKEQGEELIYINKEIQADLVWAADHISKSDGVHLIVMELLGQPLNYLLKG